MSVFGRRSKNLGSKLLTSFCATSRDFFNCAYVASWLCPSLSGTATVDFQLERGPKVPGLVQFNSVQSSSYLFWIAVPVNPMRQRALMLFMVLVVSEVRSLILWHS